MFQQIGVFVGGVYIPSKVVGELGENRDRESEDSLKSSMQKRDRKKDMKRGKIVGVTLSHAVFHPLIMASLTNASRNEEWLTLSCFHAFNFTQTMSYNQTLSLTGVLLDHSSTLDHVETVALTEASASRKAEFEIMRSRKSSIISTIYQVTFSKLWL